MSKKSAKIAGLIEQCQGKGMDPHYLGYFECFNRGLFYEAHDVLEELWLACRGGANDRFYKGLIQFAGAFVHLQKNRLRPAVALLRLATANLEEYPPTHENLDVRGVSRIAQEWNEAIEAEAFTVNPLSTRLCPTLRLLTDAPAGQGRDPI